MKTELEIANEKIWGLEALVSEQKRLIEGLRTEKEQIAKVLIRWRERVTRVSHDSQAELLSFTVDIRQIYSMDRTEREVFLTEQLVMAMTMIFRDASPEAMLMKLLSKKK